MTVGDLVEATSSITADAADWDPVGLQLGDASATVSRVGVCHEVSHRVVDAATEAGVEVLVAYHPLLFQPTNRLVAGSDAPGRAHRLVREGISLLVVHTGWDVAEGGTADALAHALGISVDGTFAAVRDEPDAPGLGRHGTIDAQPLGAFADAAATALGAVAMRVAGERDAIVTAAAVLPGSGSSFAGEAAAVADVLVTGDVSHHRAVAALDAGLAVVDVGHAPSERPGMASLVRWIDELGVAPVTDLTHIVTSPWESP